LQTQRCRCGSPLRTYIERECLGCGTLSLYDVQNVDAFVADAIRDGRARLSPAQREELHAEGRQIMLRLARQYQPGKGGRDAENSRFSGFAAKYLRLKLSDAYNRVVQRDDVEGEPAQRPALSLEVLNDRPVASQNGYEGYLDGLEAEIDRSATLEKQYLRLAMEGVDEREAAQLLRLERSEIRAIVAILRLRLDGERQRIAA
jgi:hypothetical protein